MTNYAVINKNIVDNVIVADSKEIAESVTGFECVELPSGFTIGDRYENEVFTSSL